MIPQAYENLIETCNKSLLSLEDCITVADACEKVCAKTMSCPSGAQDFIAQSKDTIAACEACIKVCDEMMVQMNKERHFEHREALKKCVKTLGDCIRVCRESIDKCSQLRGCSTACVEARQACEEAVIAIDECIESCEKHEVIYRHIKTY